MVRRSRRSRTTKRMKGGGVRPPVIAFPTPSPVARWAADVAAEERQRAKDSDDWLAQVQRMRAAEEAARAARPLGRGDPTNWRYPVIFVKARYTDDNGKTYNDIYEIVSETGGPTLWLYPITPETHVQRDIGDINTVLRWKDQTVEGKFSTTAPKRASAVDDEDTGTVEFLSNAGPEAEVWVDNSAPPEVQARAYYAAEAARKAQATRAPAAAGQGPAPAAAGQGPVAPGAGVYDDAGNFLGVKGGKSRRRKSKRRATRRKIKFAY